MINRKGQFLFFVLLILLLFSRVILATDSTGQDKMGPLERDWLFQCDAMVTSDVLRKEIQLARDVADRLIKGNTNISFNSELATLSVLEKKIESVSDEERTDLYFQIRQTKRVIIFKNPLIDFDRIIAIDVPYPKGTPNDAADSWGHESRHRLGFMAQNDGRLLSLSLDPNQKPENLLPDCDGSFWRPDLSFDTQKILFCFKPKGEKNFHLFESNRDGSNRRQLTFGNFDDLDPIYTPDGHILFCTTRTQNYVRCMPMSPSYALARCDADVCAWVSDKNYITWGATEKWNPNSKLVLLPGYCFDLLDTETLLNRLEYRDGLFILPDGMSYRLLVFDPMEDQVPVAVMKKLQFLAEQGAPIILGDTKPVRSTGLTDWEKADTQVKEMAQSLWSNPQRSGDKTMEEYLAEYSLLPDVEGPFTFLHRKTEAADLYFLTGTGTADILFRVAGQKAELWNPVDGSVSPLSGSITEDGRTRISLTLPENGSVFVVFSKGELNKTPPKTIQRGPLQTLNKPWHVAFDPIWGGPEQATFEQLTLWNEHEDPGIRFYSGTALYSYDFTLTQEEANHSLILSLGEVHDLAEVRLNGHSLGTVWTAPWEIALSEAVQPGTNHLEILVTNCWSNRLIGDAGLPPEKRLTKTNVVLENENDKMAQYRGYTTKVPLMPSGLAGPVVLFTTHQEKHQD